VIRGIDHIVIPVRDLERAVADYNALGFTVVLGGRHSGLDTHNALIAFGDGCYFELIAFLTSPQAPVHWWYEALLRGGGLTDFCVSSDNLEKDVSLFRRAGVEMSAPFAMSRERPDGFRINWELAINENQKRGLVPFFIRDITPREERVPRNHRHRNGAARVEGLVIVVPEIGAIRTIYEVALGTSGKHVKREDLQADGVRFPLGVHNLQLVAPRGDSGAAAERLRSQGPSLLEVRLSGTAQGVIDAASAHGARILFV
jgi:catechol 2,3-dioxygenase-like lactoylglutathione lyase family enzyme